MKQKNQESQQQLKVESYEFEPIKGYPMLNWKGKRPFTSTQYFPAQLKESYGKPGPDGWMNKIFWGDNLQVMSHLLKEFRGKVDLIYIDPPFDSKADYKKEISIKGKSATSDQSIFEEKQYGDIWSNDEYLQFMFDRLVILRELLSDSGSIFVHCDWHRDHHLRCILDEVFGSENMINEIVWRRKGGSALGSMSRLSAATDRLLWYSKTSNYKINSVYMPADEDYIEQQFRYTDDSGRKYMITVMRSPSPRPNLMYDYKGYKMPPNGWAVPLETMKRLDSEGRLHFPDSKEKQIYKKIYLDEYPGQQINDLWADISTLKGKNAEIVGYPTQKPEDLLERVITLASNEGDLIFDAFIGSGTTASVAGRLKRKFLGCDINLASISITAKRLSSGSLNFQIFNVNNYDIFRNPIEAKEILLSTLEISKLSNSIYDGEKDGRMVKVMPVNRIASKSDLNDLITGFDRKTFEKRQKENPNKPVEKILLVCMGHEPDLKAHLEKEVEYKLDIEIVDILRDKQDLQFKRESEAKIKIKKDTLVIEKFFPMNLLQKLSLQKEKVTDWRELVESVLIDWNYDGAVLEPQVIDIPEKDEFVKGEYEIPKDAGTIRVKITDLLSESIEVEVSRD